MKKLRLGLVGCGGMMTTHLNGIELVETVEITAVCDTVQENAEKVAQFLRGLGQNPVVTTDWKTMPEHIDAVMVALPHDLHFECGMFFAFHNKHILMEKPLCNTEEECVRLIEECEKRNLKFMCAYPVRYWPGIIKLKEYMDSGEYGKAFKLSVWTEQYTKYDKPNGETHWAHTARIGGGQLFSHGCHYVDVMLWLLGEPLYGAHFGTRVGTEWLLREGTSDLIMKFEGGINAYHGATWGAKGSKLGYNFQLHMEKGMLEYDHAAGEIRLYNGNGIHKPGESEKFSYDILWSRGGPASKETQHEIRHFADCVFNDKVPNTNARQSLQSLRVIWALYNAEHNNEIADLRGLGFKNV